MTMTTATMSAYLRERAQGAPAAGALRSARYIAAGPLLDWTYDRTGRDVASWTADGLDMSVTIAPDDYPEQRGYVLSDHAMPGAVRVDRALWYLPESGYTLPSLARDYRAQGMARGIAWQAARESLEAEYREDIGDDYGALVVTVAASRAGVELASGSIGTTVSYGADALRHAEELAADLAPEVAAEARATIARIVA